MSDATARSPVVSDLMLKRLIAVIKAQVDDKRVWLATREDVARYWLERCRNAS